MTLYIGRHVIGMNPVKPLVADADNEWESTSPKNEMSVEYEIVDLSGHTTSGNDTFVWAKLRQVK